MGAETAATPVSVKIETEVSLRQTPFPGDAGMPLPLTDAELAMLHALAAPIDANRRPEFHDGRDDEARGCRSRCDRTRRSASDRAQMLREFWSAPPRIFVRAG